MENALNIGKAGEYFVCFDLVSQGYTAYLAEQGLNYDVVLDYNDRLYKIQVKTTSEHRKTPQRKSHVPGYIFHARRCGKGGNRRYQNNDFDIIAFVSLKDKVAAYLPINEYKNTIVFRVPEFRGRYHNELMEAKRDKVRTLLSEGMSFAQIAEKYNQTHVAIRRMISEPAKQQGSYIDEHPIQNILEHLS